MSKKLFMGFALALALVGCSQEEELVNMSGEPLKDLTGEIVEAGSRTYLGSDGSVLWSEGDAISLFKKNGYHQKYTVREYNTSSTGFDYANYSNKLSYTNDLHYAVYPFSEGHSINGSTLTLDLSSLANQDYTDNTFENGKAVMVAKSATTQLAFTNAFSLANVQLTGEQGISPDEKIIVTEIEVTSATKTLAGTATVKMTQDKPAAVFDNNSGFKTITLNCGTGVELTTAPTNFYILMPAVTFPAGDLTVTIKATVAGEEKEYVSNLNKADAPFYRSKVTTLPKTIYFEDWTGSTEATIKNVENVTAANDALQNNTGVDIADATGTTESTPITVPAKTEDEAAKEHTIDLSDAKMPTDGTQVYIEVEQGDASSDHTVETLKVVVPEGATDNNFTIFAPGTTVTLTTANGTVIKTITAATANETLVISSGITVNMLKVQKGNVRIEAGAKVNTIERDETNDNAVTFVYLQEGASIENYPTDAKILVIGADNKVSVNNAAQLQSALENAVAEIKLLGDITIGETLNITNNFVIDGNNHTLTYTGADRAIDVKKETNGANLTLNNLTVNCTASYCERGVNYNTNGTLVLDGVVVEGKNVTYALNLPGFSDNALVNISKSTLTGNIALNVWGENATINVTNSDLISVDKESTENYNAISLNNDGTNVAEGTIITVTGGSIIAKDEKDQPTNAVSNSTMTGEVIISAQTTVVGKVSIPVAIVDYGTTQFYSCPSLQLAIDKVIEGKSGIVKLVRDITLEETIKVVGGHPVVIDLNGHTITGTDNATGSFGLIQNNGELTVKNTASTPGDITLTAKNNRGWNAYSSVISNNPGGNLTVESGVVIEHLGGTDMAYGIDNLTNGKGTKAVTTVDGATVKSTYRAIRQFLNGIEAINKLHVKSGIIEGTNKSIWMQDPSKNANTGNLCVDANAQLKGNVYLSVTEGSTEWPVEVSIAESALVGDSEVLLNEHVEPLGYELVKANRIYSIIRYNVVNNRVELVTALANGENVKLAASIAVAKSEVGSNGYGATGIQQTKGGIINGNGKNISVDAWTTWDSAISTTGGTIKNVNVTGGMRGIFMPGATSDVYIDNVVFNNVIYTFNSDAGNKNYGVYISNSTLNGWTSHSDVHKEVVYTNCSFGEGNGYAFCRPYGPTTFVNCKFAEGFEVEAIGQITFENCTIGGVALTADNLATLVTSKIENATVK